MSQLKVPVERLAHGQGLKLPEYMSAQAAGMDLPAAILEQLEVAPGEIVLIPTGLKLAIPEGHEGQVRPRSGLAVKKGITVVNAPGTIDADYRGEVKVALINLGRQPVTIQRGERVAQLVIAPMVQARLDEVSQLPPSHRGEGGFGHTGS